MIQVYNESQRRREGEQTNKAPPHRSFRFAIKIFLKKKNKEKTKAGGM